MNRSAHQVSIVDCTLREGNQSPGIAFDGESSIRIANGLSRLGVEEIEIGHPAISDKECARIQKVVTLKNRSRLLCHARANPRDINAVAEVGAEGIGIFVGINPLSRATRLGKRSIREVLEMIRTSVYHAKRLRLRVRFTLEDATRTDKALSLKAYAAAVEAGADRICLADTVGCASPDEIKNWIHMLRQSFEVPIEVHAHNDRGLALANSLAAVEAGARYISCAVNGLGERTGIVDTAQVLANLHFLGVRPLLHPRILQRLSKEVSVTTRVQVGPFQPITGRFAFSHTSKLHKLAVVRDPNAYSWITPRKLARRLCTREYALLPTDLTKLFSLPLKISAAELLKHRKGPGQRFVFIDDRLVADCRNYSIVRHIPEQISPPAPHVDEHAHCCDSIFLFIGKNSDLTGLKLEILVGSVKKVATSPLSVFIPAGVRHYYRILSGSGYFVNWVGSGSYNSSLYETPFNADNVP